MNQYMMEEEPKLPDTYDEEMLHNNHEVDELDSWINSMCEKE